MDLLDQAPARTVLADAEVDPNDRSDGLDQLTAFAQRYRPRFQRVEHHRHALTILRGQLTGLQRQTTEPLATQAGQQRRPLQLFVDAGGWHDLDVLGELRLHVREELGDPAGVFVLDNSAFPKQGQGSCGVARQWCGRLGKVENCQVGVLVAYVAPRGQALVDTQLYLPQAWADAQGRRVQTDVPQEVTFPEPWRIGLDVLDRVRATLPGTWVVGDDEFGRGSALRHQWRFRQRRYVLDVPCSTWVREISERRPPTRPGGQPRWPEFERVERWVARPPRGRWKKVRVRDGAKGPVELDVLLATVPSKDEGGCVGARERLVVLRTRDAQPEIWYTLSNAHAARRGELARVPGSRHPLEELLGEGKGEVGLGHYEVRSWVGGQHQLTRSLLALWFLQWERLRLGEKN